ncbi:MAG: hypothetical protein US11_C0004G0021 [Candidatus Roizmanbacteria bacterium GW2011_GWA2_36_23]|uniref:ABC transporter domain-containing protein n=1 Tax=Candidatus Roizmanbacteria bacterium GW2011_GWA2_36_23 TaxID=1618480 RepID=A0A0G0HCW7_9BACT|nr:MAG: hypothetical protein US11_C0004G0021 [Candidatus Roizmanbacteria bacterium GW2011_GWA2_36_23]
MTGIQLRNVTFGYRKKDKLLDNINLNIESGSFIGITGINGSGKTTFAFLLNGLVPQEIPGYYSGNTCVEGVDTRSKPVSYFSSKVGLVFQNPDQMIFNLTVFEEVAFGLRNLDKQSVIDRVKNSLQSVGLKGFENRDPQTLSFGQKQKLCMACILAVDPQYIVLDEVTSMLDYKSTVQLYDILVSLHKKGKTVIIIEHDTDWLAKYANRVIILHGGKIRFYGTPKQVFSNKKTLSDLGIKIPADL